MDLNLHQIKQVTCDKTKVVLIKSKRRHRTDRQICVCWRQQEASDREANLCTTTKLGLAETLGFSAAPLQHYLLINDQLFLSVALIVDCQVSTKTLHPAQSLRSLNNQALLHSAAFSFHCFSIRITHSWGKQIRDENSQTEARIL